MKKKSVWLAVFAVALVATGPSTAAPRSAAVAAGTHAALQVDVSCFGVCGGFSADHSTQSDTGAGGVASVSFNGAHSAAMSTTDVANGMLHIAQSGSLQPPIGASANVFVYTEAVVDDTITLSAPAVLTLRGSLVASVNGGGRDYAIGEIAVGGATRFYQEYDAPAGGSQPYSVSLSLPAGTTTFRAALYARLDGTPSGGDTYNGSVAPSTLSFAIDVPAGVTAVSGSGRLPLVQAAAPTLTVSDVARSEGNAGTAPFGFTVALSTPSTAPVTVNYATADGTAVAPGDYNAVGGTVTFAPGETTKNVDVPVVGDTAVEPNETFELRLTSASGATIGDASGIGTIANDDSSVTPPPTGGSTTVTATVATLLTVSAPAALSFPPLAVGMTSDPVAAPVTVTTNSASGYQLSASRTSFTGGDIPLSISSTGAPSGGTLDVTAATAVPTSGTLNIGHRSGSATSASGDSWSTSLVLGPVPFVASGSHESTLTFTVVAL